MGGGFGNLYSLPAAQPAANLQPGLLQLLFSDEVVGDADGTEGLPDASHAFHHGLALQLAFWLHIHHGVEMTAANCKVRHDGGSLGAFHLERLAPVLINGGVQFEAERGFFLQSAFTGNAPAVFQRREDEGPQVGLPLPQGAHSLDDSGFRIRFFVECLVDATSKALLGVHMFVAPYFSMTFVPRSQVFREMSLKFRQSHPLPQFFEKNWGGSRVSSLLPGCSAEDAGEASGRWYRLNAP